MGQALYRKYRSKTMVDIVGQEHITKTLTQAIKTNNLSHAYLFSGPRGVGKTSIARILAHDINQLPYEEHQNHIDIIEIDAASNNGIDDIRDLREKIYISPSIAAYKVYIIDEVHMLSKQAFNGLLKTLEEPPAHVVFILATTEAHKLPDTIISRTQRFQFKPVEIDKVIAHLKHIAKLESINIDDEALKLIAAHGQGSFRDSIGLLDQASNYTQPITALTINNLIGLPPADLIDQLIKYLEKADTKQLTQTLNKLVNQGYTAPMIASHIASILRAHLINEQPIISNYQTLKLLKNLIDVDGSSQPEVYLEICLLKAIITKAPTITSPQPNTAEKVNIVEEIKETKKEPSTIATKEIGDLPENKDKEHKPALTIQPISANNQLDWEAVLNLLKAKYNTLYGIARMAQVDTSEPGLVRLQFAFAFHQKRINETKNRELILDALKQVSGHDIELECIIDKTLLAKPKPPIEEPNLETISSIFGNSEKFNE